MTNQELQDELMQCEPSYRIVIDPSTELTDEWEVWMDHQRKTVTITRIGKRYTTI